MIGTVFLAKAVRPFQDLAKCPPAIWLVIGEFVLDSIAYFGVLTLMTEYLGKDLRWGDAYAGVAVSLFTMLITLTMLGLGSVVEGFGLRRAIVGLLAVATIGRVVYFASPPGGKRPPQPLASSFSA